MPSPSPLAGEGKLSRSGSRERARRISKLRGRAKETRLEQTDAQHRFWQLLRLHRFAGYNFRRQVPLDFYTADFLCFAQRLIIELDVGQHADNKDERRDAYMESLGFHILRIWNNDLFTNEEGGAEAILSALRSPPLPIPSPVGGERGLSGASHG